ncbi:MAG TPA: DUF3293 domain-containing protein [Nevskiaceae bacterium]|nr:DUF3293 domain-containing protein [Nevskiaceae bacterium]
MNTLDRRQQWEQVYRQAEYQVLLDEGTLTFRIGVHDADLEARLVAATGVREEWFLITPCNPRSERAREELNLFYFNELRYELEARSGSWFKACNHDPAGEWPDEPGFLVVDAERTWLIDLGRRFLQNALVTARLGEAPRLLWLD